MTTNWKSELQVEFDRAEASLAAKNEGQMRVCARRAAGIAIREYLIQRGIKPPSISAYKLLEFLENQPDTPADLRRAAIHLRLRVTEDFKFPLDVDLVTEAKKICTALVPDWED